VALSLGDNGSIETSGMAVQDGKTIRTAGAWRGGSAVGGASGPSTGIAVGSAISSPKAVCRAYVADAARKGRSALAAVLRDLGSVGLREIALNFAPVVAWLVTYGILLGMIPSAWKPQVSVRVLPRLEKLLHYPHRWFNRDPHPFLDVFAAVPYTFHPLLPLLMLCRIVLRAGGVRRGLVFARCFGTMCLTGVLIQLFVPVAPPWYFELFGELPADYSMKGHPALLARVDQLTGSAHYQSLYGSSRNAVVFGSFPSLHAAWPYMIASFRPQIGWPMWLYTFWVWWAALYLQHHYLADLVSAAVLVEVVLFFLDGQYDSTASVGAQTASGRAADDLSRV